MFLNKNLKCFKNLNILKTSLIEYLCGPNVDRGLGTAAVEH